MKTATAPDFQISIFDMLKNAPTVEQTKDTLFSDDDNLAQRFAKFHEENPHVYAALVSLCLQVKSRGRRRWSINAAFEVLRWAYFMQTSGDDFKLNNSYRAFYARMIMDHEAGLRDFFETREQKAA